MLALLHDIDPKSHAILNRSSYNCKLQDEQHASQLE